MKTLGFIAGALLACLLAAQDTVPQDRIRPKDPTPATMKVGDKACAFPITASQELHVWIAPDSLSRAHPKDRCMAAVVERLKDGWRATLYVGLTPHATDAECKRFGWTRMTEVVAK